MSGFSFQHNIMATYGQYSMGPQPLPNTQHSVIAPITTPFGCPTPTVCVPLAKVSDHTPSPSELIFDHDMDPNQYICTIPTIFFLSDCIKVACNFQPSKCHVELRLCVHSFSCHQNIKRVGPQSGILYPPPKKKKKKVIIYIGFNLYALKV